MATEIILSPAATLVDGRLPPSSELSTLRKYSLLLVFCLAQLIDVFNNSALFSAIPTLITSLHMTESESTWIISAFQLTFASFLLVVRALATKALMRPLNFILRSERAYLRRV
jgi:MFS family permease